MIPLCVTVIKVSICIEPLTDMLIHNFLNDPGVADDTGPRQSGYFRDSRL